MSNVPHESVQNDSQSKVRKRNLIDGIDACELPVCPLKTHSSTQKSLKNAENLTVNAIGVNQNDFWILQESNNVQIVHNGDSEQCVNPKVNCCRTNGLKRFCIGYKANYTEIIGPKIGKIASFGRVIFYKMNLFLRFN